MTPPKKGGGLTVGSLFSGIGGLDLGLERAGMTVVWQSEIDPYASRVLAKHWPDVPNLGDVTKIDWSSVPRVDLICGGYPCQPFSVAGSRAGADDTRHLWPHFADALRHLRPRWALLENVPGHLSLGFGDVLGDLAELGFDAGWGCVSAASVGAPHLRYRIFVVCWDASRIRRRQDGTSQGVLDVARTSGSEQRWTVADTSGRRNDGLRAGWDESRSGGSIVADTDEVGRGRRTGQLGPGGRGEPSDGGWWAAEPDVGRVAHGVPRRVDRLRTLGNAVVPQVAEWVGQRIMEAA